MTRVLSGIQPSGEIHLGNYLGALLQWVDDQHQHESYYSIVDLHALTLYQPDLDLAANTIKTACVLLAAGLDPQVCTLFVQSQVPEHPRLTWLLECTASMGQLERMTQFKEKAAKQEEGIGVGIFTYPVLQAADILLYDADRVPVGEDQRQHLELARDLAQRFNFRFGETFVVPEPVTPPMGAKIQDLQEPSKKMSKSAASQGGTIWVLDDPKTIQKKLKAAVTDSQAEVSFDPANKPGVSNLLSILAAATASTPNQVAKGYTQYGPLKAAAADAVIELLAPVQTRYRELADDPGEVTRILKVGAARAHAIASTTYARAAKAIGLVDQVL